MPDARNIRPRTARLLPFSIDTQTWDCLASDIRRVLWAGWSLRLQLEELAYGRQHAGAVDEARRAGLIKPVPPLTPEQSVKRAETAEAGAARLQAAKRVEAEKIANLQKQVADEEKFGR